MEKLKKFFVNSMIGGLIVILPVALLVAAFQWVFSFVAGLIQPLTNILVVSANMKEFIASVLVILIILCISFFIGVMVRTNIGRFLHKFLEDKIFKAAPGYTLIKEVILQLFGNKKSPFSSVALVQLFENSSVLVTAFVTEEHKDGSFTIFSPTGLNPTSGLIYHVEKKYVHLVDISTEEAMRSIISCGAGSGKLISAYKNKLKK